jgi:hypothetical protein
MPAKKSFAVTRRRRVRERIDPVAYQELGVGALDLEQGMAVMMGVPDQRTVHVEQSNPAESTMGDAQGRRHQYLPSGFAKIS